MINQKILNQIKANKGGTLNSKGILISYTKGYQLSKKDLCIISLKQLTKNIINNYLKTLKNNDFLGIWIDDGQVYIDKSVHYIYKKSAIKQGKKLYQISLWDWSANTALYLWYNAFLF